MQQLGLRLLRTTAINKLGPGMRVLIDSIFLTRRLIVKDQQG